MTLKQVTNATRKGRIIGNPPSPNIRYLTSTCDATILQYELFIAWKEAGLKLNQDMKLNSLKRLKVFIEKKKHKEATLIWLELIQQQLPHFEYCIAEMTSLRSQALLERAKQLFLASKNTTPLAQIKQDQLKDLDLSINHMKGAQRLMQSVLQELQIPEKMRRSISQSPK